MATKKTPLVLRNSKNPPDSPPESKDPNGKKEPGISSVWRENSNEARGRGALGTVDGLPFATRDGSPKGQEPKGEPFNMNRENRPQAKPDAMPKPVFVTPGSHMASREQTPGTISARIGGNPSVPADGPTPPATSRYGGTGSVGNTSRPFKLRG
jgi:hypothetical protein